LQEFKEFEDFKERSQEAPGSIHVTWLEGSRFIGRQLYRPVGRRSRRGCDRTNIFDYIAPDLSRTRGVASLFDASEYGLGFVRIVRDSHIMLGSNPARSGPHQNGCL